MENAVADIPAFCSYLEKRLGLTERDPQQFDPHWLTAEGLAQSKGEFEDFLEPGTCRYSWPATQTCTPRLPSQRRQQIAVLDLV